MTHFSRTICSMVACLFGIVVGSVPAVSFAEDVTPDQQQPDVTVTLSLDDIDWLLRLISGVPDSEDESPAPDHTAPPEAPAEQAAPVEGSPDATATPSAVPHTPGQHAPLAPPAPATTPSTVPEGPAPAASATASAPAAEAGLPAQPTWSDIVGFLGRYTAGTLAIPDITCKPDFICGVTTLGGAKPVIHLDPKLNNSYFSPEGRYVLVHEAAHSHSWWRYGSMEKLIEASERLTGLTGKAAIEYMADCATIAKIGWSGGTYTRSCTPEQLAEGQSYWTAMPPKPAVTVR